MNMSTLARQLDTCGIELRYGTVRRPSGTGHDVALDDGERQAQVAASCLISPCPGDLVLVSQDEDGGCYILAVLARREPMSQAEIELPGGAALRAVGGPLTLASDQEVACASRKLSIHADEGEASFGVFTVLGRLLSVQAERIKSVAESVDSVWSQLTMRLGSFFRFVRDEEECQAGSMRHLVEKTAVIQSREALIQAKEQVKIDGETVHLG